jgi:hypothetical protein
VPGDEVPQELLLGLVCDETKRELAQRHEVLITEEAGEGTGDPLGKDRLRPGRACSVSLVTGREHIDFVAHSWGVSDRTERDQLVERFGVILDRPAHTLSKGNRQKIAIVLASDRRC